MTLIDSHTHLDDRRFGDDRDAVVQRAVDAGISCMVSIGTGEGPPDLEAGIRVAEQFAPVYASVGIHPEHAPVATQEHFDRIAGLLTHPKVLLVGEIGLDYYWKPYDAKLQADVFVTQLEIAATARKAISIHTREAWDDMISLLREHWAPKGLPCIMHCFTGNPQQARQALDLGFFLSFSGVVTYPKATDVHESAKLAPLDRMLVETDAPYLAPVPFRGKRNEPSYVVHTLRKIAELRGDDPDRLVNQTVLNFERLVAATR
ncbi:MAG TPA: TatD family hydrolase [Bryobacteraceae bacterium]|nr:TatD family hydrolase [Bryobacteraceae bacterium]